MRYFEWSHYLRLSRLYEHLPFVIPMTLLGATLALQDSSTVKERDSGLILLLFANIFSTTYAFAYNDIQDSSDDLLDKFKTEKNFISNGSIEIASGFTFANIILVAALVCYLACAAISNPLILVFGISTVTLAFLYSNYRFRLKARPIIDIISHALMLGGLQVLSGYFLYASYPSHSWALIVSVIIGSASGQLYNQLEDFEVDRIAQLKTSTQLIGENKAKYLLYCLIVLIFITWAFAMSYKVIPDYVVEYFVCGTIVMTLFRWKYDLRGNKVRGIGVLQMPFMIVVNFCILIWFYKLYF